MSNFVKMYSCVVRLGGSLLHTVPKDLVSGEEIRMLKHIHGDDSIANLKEVGVLEGLTRDEELRSLADKFSQEADKRDGRALVEKIFGVTLTDFDDWLLRKQGEAEEVEQEAAALRALNDAAAARGTLVRSGATQ